MEKFLVPFRTLVIGLITMFAAESIACDYTFNLYDSNGDGWNGGTLTILVNGVPVASNLTLQNGNGPEVFTITVNDGDTISTIYTPGSWPEENYYEVFGSLGQFIVRDGCDDYSCTPLGGFIAVAACPDKDAWLTDILSPTIGCNLTSAEVVSFKVRNSGIFTLDTFLLSYSINGGTTWVTETLYQTVLAGDSFTYTFTQTANMSVYGIYPCIFVVTANGDQYSGNDTLYAEVNSLPTISTFPYFEDFETGQGGWYSGGVNSSWAFGTPNSWTIDSAASGTSAWMTNLTGPYNDHEASWVASPCFDFSSLTYPIFEMKIWYETYQWYDGAALEYTTDGFTWHRIGLVYDTINWYNRDWIDGLMMYFGNNAHGWGGSSYGYLTASRVLPAHLAGVPSVQFRVVFASTEYHYGGYDGIAFDDVRIYQPPAMVLSNTSAYQNYTDPVGIGMPNRAILGFTVETQNPTDPLAVTDIRFNTTGTSNTADIAAARVLYWANNAFWTQYGQDAFPMSPFGFQDTLFLTQGNNYFYLVYDVSTSATPGNFLDAAIDSLEIDGVWYIPVNNNPTGNRQIVPPMNGTYIVNQAGGADYISLGDAVADLNTRGVSGPVVIDMAPGIYDEKITFGPVFGTSSTNTITVKSTTNDSTAVTIRDSAQLWEENWVIRFNDASHYILKHLHIKPLDGGLGRGVVLSGVNQHIHILNNYFESNDQVMWNDDSHTGIYSEHEHHHLVIRNNRISKGSYGICLYGWHAESTYPDISHNHLDEPYYAGMLLEWQKGSNVHGNRINSPITTNAFNGITCYWITDTFRITGNEVLMNSYGRGLNFWEMSGDVTNPGLIANNMVSGISSTGSDQHGIYANMVTNSLIVFNSINLVGSSAPNNSYGISVFGQNIGSGLFNNIFSNRRGGYSISINNNAMVASDYNNYHTTGANVGRYWGTAITDMAAWQATTNQDSSSFSTNPLFFSNTDLHTYNILLKGKGIPIAGVLVDFDGDLRDPSTPDLGADEFTLPAQEASLVEILSPADGCGLGLEDVIIRIANNGTAAIAGNLTASYAVSGNTPVSESVTATIPAGDTLLFTFTTKADLSVIGSDSTFLVTAYINLTGDPIQANDTAVLPVWSGYLPPAPITTSTTVNYGSSATIIAQGPGSKLWYHNLTDTSEFYIGDTLVTSVLYDTTVFYVEASNTSFTTYSPGAFVITEMCHWKSSSTGNPATGWPSYLIADDYIEISGLPSADLGGITLEQYNASSLVSSHTFPAGTLLSPQGTAIIAVGQMGSSTPSPANFYYHGNGGYTGSFGSSGTAGRVLRAPDGTIIDAAGYGNYLFPAVANVPTTEWSNPITSGTSSTAGVRLIGPDMNSGVNWIVSNSSNGQDPNVFNSGVPVPAPLSQGLCRSARVPAIANVTAFPGVDAGITQVVAPSGTILAGSPTDVVVTLHNYGINTLTSATINWRLNNVLQTPYNWTGSLPQGNSLSVTIANLPLSPGENCLKVWPNLPNGLPDNFNQNDTAYQCITACLSGNFTIGPATAGTFDYNTFGDAIANLTAAGVCGSVIFDVYPGTYSEQLSIPKINGTSTTNTITFRGATADSTDVIVQHSATSSTFNWVVRLNRASHITFKHMTLQATGTNWGRVVELMDSADHITFSHCVILTNTTSTSSNFAGFFSTSNLASNHLTIHNNIIEGGYYSIYHNGSFTNTKKGLTVTNNILKDYYYFGIYTNYVDDISIEENEIENRASSQSLYNIYIYYSKTPGVITRNRLISINQGFYYGMYIAYCDGTPTQHWLISNNFLSQEGNPNGTVVGIYTEGNHHISFYNNSISIHGGSVTDGRAFSQYGGSGTNIVNNIFSNHNHGYAATYDDPWAINQLDFNNYYTEGPNLIHHNFIHSTLISHQNSSGKDLSSHQIPPPYTSTHDLALTNTFLSGRATPLAEVPVDFFGATRTPTPTIGAHEVPLIPQDAGVLAILSPDGQQIVFEDDTVVVQVVLMNFGLDTLYTIPVSYTLNQGAAVQANYNGMILPFGQDTMLLPAYIAQAGNTYLCVYTALPADTNHFNDTTCIHQFAFSNIDAAVTAIAPMDEGCGLGQDTVTIHIANVSTSAIPAGFTASYQRHPGAAVITETVPLSIGVSNTIQYTFTTLVNLATQADTTWEFRAWVTVPDDNLPGNDTATRHILSLEAPTAPVIVSPVSIPFGSSTILDANTTLYTEWYANASDTIPIGSGSTFQTPLLYDTTTYYAAQFFGDPNQQIVIGTPTSQNSSTGYPTPYGNWYWGNKEQYLIRASELTAASVLPGFINSLAFEVTSPRGVALQNFTIKIGHTTQDVMTNSFITTGLTEVYYSTGYVDVMGWNEHPFSTPFQWDGISNLVVEVCFNNTSYTGNGVVWLTSPGFTATTRSNADNTGVCGNTSGSTTTLRPVIRFSSTSLGCVSPRTPVVVNTTNMPPLGKPMVTPESMQVSLTGCNDSETRNIRVRNIGNAMLQYTTYGGSHDVDTTSTLYYSGSNYPDTTSHFFTSIPMSTDSLYLEITINGTYSSSAAHASLIIEGTYLGIIPDGNVSNGTDITVTYAFGGTQLEDWLSDGELLVRIGNSASVNPWNGTRMHRVRAYTKPAPWISMSQIVGGIAVGDSLDIPVAFSGTGLPEGSYYATIPLAFNHPGYPYVKIPVNMTLTGSPEISTQPCINFSDIFQYDSTTDSIVINNTGCADLVIHNIVVTNQAFTPQYSQLSIPPFGSATLPVVFTSNVVMTYLDTLTLQSNVADYHICLNATTLSPPVILLSQDTINVALSGCNDSLVVPIQISNQGDASLHWSLNYAQPVSLGTGQQQSALAGPIYISGPSSSFWHSNHISLFTPAELVHHGMITSLAWRKANSHGYLHNDATYRIYLKHTNLQTVPTSSGTFSTEMTGSTMVYQSIQQGLPADTGWVHFDFNTVSGFTYNGTQNLMVMVEWYRPNHATGAVDWYFTGETGKAHTWSGSSTPPTSNYGTHQRPDITVGFIGLPDYITAQPDSGVVPPQSSQTATLTFHAAGLASGIYQADFEIRSNDPLTPEKTVYTTMDVIGAPELLIPQVGCLSFDTTLQGGLHTLDLLVINTGCADLMINSLTTTSNHYYGTSVISTLAPFDSAYLQVTFNPQTTGLLSDTLVITTNDGVQVVCLEGFALPAPSIAFSTNHLQATINNCNDSTMLPLQILNQGQGTLYFHILDGQGNTTWMTIDTTGLGSGTHQQQQGAYQPGDNIAPLATVTASSCNTSPCSAFNNSNLGVCGTQQVWVSTSSPPTLTPHVNYIDFEWSSQVSIDGLTIHHGQATARLLNGATLYFWNGSGWVEFYTFTNLPAQCENVVPFPTVNTTKLRITSFRMTAGGQNSNPSFREIEVHLAPPSISVAPSSYININIKLNANGLNSDTYQSHLRIESNDPLSPSDTVAVTMQVLGAPEIRFSTSQSCLNFDTIIQGFTASETVWIYNDGCDTLMISSISSALPQFIISHTNLDLLPGDSADITITFVPDTAILFTDTLHFITNGGTHAICLSGVGIDAPVVSFAPASLSHTFTNCHDSVVKSVTIYNTGIGNLFYSFSNLLGSDFTQTSTESYTTTGAVTHHLFTGTPAYSDSMKVIVTQNGDYNSSSKYSWLHIDGVNLGVIPNSSPANGTDITNTYMFTGSQLAGWIADGQLEISIQNTGSVQHWSGLQSIHKVELIIYGTPWLSASRSADTVLSGDSSTVHFTFKTADLPSGTYQTDIQIASNDPVNQLLTIPCTMAINGSADIAFSSSCLHFGQVMQFASKTDTLTITNTGCSNLVISSLFSTLSDFSLGTSYILLAPGQQYHLPVTFNPTLVGPVSDNINMITNIGSFMVCLTGQGIDASILDVSPYTFNKTITNCNDTITDVIKVRNLGTGTLTYQVFGGRGLSGDSTVLVIRDVNPWGVDIEQFIHNQFGVTPHSITSSQIGSTNFNSYDIIITLGGQTTSYYNAISAHSTTFHTYVESGGIALYMLANTQVTNVTLAGGSNMVYGSAEGQNIIVAAGHPLISGLTNPLIGSNANSNYLTNLPANAKTITQANISGQPTTVEYEIGGGLVIATGMLWEYHSGLPIYNISSMLFNGLSYAFANIGASPSWISFAYTPTGVSANDSSMVTVQFNSTGIPNGTYQSNITVYSNDPVNPQFLVPCTLTVNGAAQMASNVNCVLFDTVIEGATVIKPFRIYNTGCDDLVITNINSLSSEYVSSVTSATVEAGDSLTVMVHFTPLTTGQRNSSLSVITNAGTLSLCLEGYSINPPVITVQPAFFDITINSCHDTVTQNITLTNSGAGQAVYHILGLYGGNIDVSSTKSFVATGATTTHTFTNLPPNIDTLMLEITLSGDFDQAHEYADLLIEGSFIGQIDDGDITAGIPATDYFGFGGSQLSGWLNDGQLVVTVQNSPTVDHWTGLNSFHSIRLIVNGNHWILPTSFSDTLTSFSSTQVPVHFFSTNMPAGIHHYTLLVGSNDPGNAQVAVPCTLTVVGDAQWVFDQNCLHFDSTMIGAFDQKTLTVINSGCDSLIISSIVSSVNPIVPLFSSAVVLPHDTLWIPVTFTPLASGNYAGDLTLTSNLGVQTICLTGNGLPAPTLVVDQTQLTSSLVCDLIETQEITITNTGQAVLHYQLNPASASFIQTTGAAGSLFPGDTAIVQFIFDKTGLTIGTHITAFTLNSNDPLVPTTAIQCTLMVPHLIVPVNLGPDITVCDNQQVILNAGPNFASYLWDDASTGSTRQVFSDGVYYVTAIDQSSCVSSDTIEVTFFPSPVVDAGNDTAICTGFGIVRDASATGVVMTQKSIQIGYNTQFSAANHATPFLTSYNAGKKQVLIRSNEMIHNGFKRGWIESIEINIGALGTPNILSDFAVHLGHTGASSLQSGFISDLELVYTATTHSLQFGWHTITFSTPFYYNGTDNLIVEFCFTNSSRNFNSSIQFHTSPFNHASRYAFSNHTMANGCGLGGGYTTNLRPNIRFNGLADEATYSWTGPGGFISNTPVLRINPVLPQHSGYFQLSVDNGIGCMGTDQFLMMLSPLPVVDAGIDLSVLEGASISLSGTVSGGQAPHTHYWAPGGTLSDSAILQPVATPLTTTTYTLTATGSNNCSSSDQMVLTVIPTFDLTGTLSYNNAAFTPLNGSVVYLRDQMNNLLDSATADIAGGFTFPNYPPGTYKLSATTSKPWGGVNATDALVVQRHVINLNPLTGLRATGADVNLSNTVSSVDALLILRRTLGMDTAFTRGNWVFEQPTVQITNSNLVRNFHGLATGDVNGSYLPAVLRQVPVVEITPKGWISGTAGTTAIPLTAGEHIHMGAMTLFFELPDPGIVIKSVSSPLPGLMYHIHQGRLKIVWSDEEGFIFHPGDLVLTIYTASDGQPMDPFWLKPTLSSEIADIAAVVLEPVVLHAPNTANEYAGITSELLAYNQPNPFTDKTQIVIHIPTEGQLLIEVFDMLGKRIRVIEDAHVEEGIRRYDFNRGDLPAGVYHYRLTLETTQQAHHLNQSMVIVR